MPLFSQSILYFFLLFSISFAHYSEFGNQCFGENCENPQYLEDTPHCIGLECESKESLISMISDLQKEKHAEYLKPVQNPSLGNRHSALDILTGQTTSSFSSQQCSICNRTDLCINNGICVPDVINPWKNYYCICPDNTSGRNCQKIISCNPNPCGKNADCYVANHQINCICKPGYTASHNGRNCDLKVIESCLTGDPHYTTYDNLHFDYQGTCPYVFSQPCSILPLPFLWFSVRAKNELLSRGSHISQVSEVEVDLHNITIHIDQRSKFVLVNGVQVLLPFFYPNKSYWIVRIKFTGSKYMIQNDQGITVTFTTSGTLCVEVPNIPEFQGPNTLCGLAGNIDGKWSDDVVNRNGSVLPITSSRQPNKNNNFVFNQAEDSWITDQFLVLRPNQENCINGQVLDNTTNCAICRAKLQDSQAAVDACAPIKQAESSTGPFAVCSALGSELIDNYYYNCVFDVCISQNYKCTSLSNFLHFCQQALPGVVQDPNWREEVNCPLACPPHSHHELCVSSCPSTCADPFPEQCDQGCVDGCTCDPGYIIDNSISGILKCITIDKCGCLDENGNIHQPNSPWLTQNCTIYHECRNGTMYSEYRPCSELAQCIDSSFYAQCKCDVGYRGDGYNCTDINECVETPGICGHGTCTNLPGTYHCHCNDYWLGTNCNQYKPRRHCADLYVYWGNRTSGVYSLNPAYTLPNRAPFEPFDVYCEMSIDGGGFTLISSDTDNLNSNKTYSDYLTGFGDPNLQKVWIGLEFIHQLTIRNSQTLRLNIHRCASNGRPERTTDCTYPTFVVLNATNQYAVVIRQPCDGTEAGPNYYEDGWARWDLSKDGPKFSTWDIEDGVDVKVLSNKINNDAYRYSCSKSNFNTGWWYVNDQLCGAANLNGVRYQCPSIPVESEKYLRWSEGTIQQSWMYLRPVGYPNYDIHP